MTNDLLSFFLSYTLQPSPPPLLKTYHQDFAEEQDLWVPRQAAREGLMFLVSKIPHAPPKLITEFLRKINKVVFVWVVDGQDVVVCGNRHTILLVHD